MLFSIFSVICMIDFQVLDVYYIDFTSPVCELNVN